MGKSREHLQDWGFRVFHAFYFLQKNPLKHFGKVRIRYARYALILVGKSRHLEGKMIDSCAGCLWWLWTLFQGSCGPSSSTETGKFPKCCWEALPSNKINIAVMDIPGIFVDHFPGEIQKSWKHVASDPAEITCFYPKMTVVEEIGMSWYIMWYIIFFSDTIGY